MAGEFSLRVYSYLDRMQPQYAAFVGTITQGDLPTEGMASLYVEVAPGNEVFRLVDIAVKSTEATTGRADRRTRVWHVRDPFPVAIGSAGSGPDRVGPAWLAASAERIKPFIASVQIITNVDPVPVADSEPFPPRLDAGARVRRCWCWNVLRPPTSTMPCNEAEKGANIKILHVSSVGRFGRMWLSGSEAEIVTARNAAVKALEELDGRPEK